jgi:hypothetical protein
MLHLSRFLRGIAPIACGALLSCGGGDDGTLFRGGGSTETGGGPDAGLGIVLPSGGDASLHLSVDGAPTGVIGGGSLDDAACATTTRKADQIPLDMYLMLDSSLSMTDFIADGKTTKWQAVQKALSSFLTAGSSAGLGVGLQYFPLIQPGVPAACFSTAECGAGGQFGPCTPLSGCSNSPIFCTTRADCPRGESCQPLGACKSDPTGPFCVPPGANRFCDARFTDPCTPVGLCDKRDVCDVATYAKPAIEVAALPGAAAALVASLNAHMPDGNTPSASALAGALTHAQALTMTNSGHRIVVVLATDGLPSECVAPNVTTEAAAVAQVSALASAAAAGKPSIPTFVIGVFSPDDVALGAPQNLDAIATAGSTGKAFIINTSQDVTTGFLDALNAIRTTALACEYAVPQPEMGQQLDYNAVNVRFTRGNGQVATVPYSGGTAQSCTDKGGWYYDVDPAAGGTPTKIEICPVSCNTLKSDTKGQVNILLGCKTESIVR